MKYTNEEAVKEIMKRSETVRKNRDKRELKYLTGICAALAAALAAVIFVIPASMSGAYSGNTVYGAFLLGREAGGYVLASVIAFVLGITVTLLCLKIRNQK